MKHYIDITLLPSVEVDIYYLWRKVFQQCHIAFADYINKQGQGDIAIALPEYSVRPYRLGNKLRLFAKDKAQLEALGIEQWLSRLLDYAHISSIKTVNPDKVTGYACFKRRTPKSSIERLARRRAKRHDITMDVALEQLKDKKVEDKVKTPYVNMQSLENGYGFKLFIERIEQADKKEGPFSSYGLSPIATVPIF